MLRDHGPNSKQEKTTKNIDENDSDYEDEEDPKPKVEENEKKYPNIKKKECYGCKTFFEQG